MDARPGSSRIYGWNGLLALLLYSIAALMPAVAAPIPLEAFAARPGIQHASISPDGRYLALIQTQGDRGVAVVVDLKNPAKKVVLGEPEGFLLTWCRWATSTRLLCGYSGTLEIDDSIWGNTRLVAVDADGSNSKVLVQNSEVAQGQFQDRILSWRPGIADTVLVQADQGLAQRDASSGGQVLGAVGTVALPAVWELNVVADRMRVRQKARMPVRDWLVDSRGNVRVGYGLEGTSISYFARLDGDKEWRRLAKFEAFSGSGVLRPVAISQTEPDKAYAIGSHDGFDAIWLIDLTDKAEPKLLHSEPGVDIESAVFGSDDRLVGFYFEREGPMIHYVDKETADIAAGVAKALPGKFVEIAGLTDDGTKYLLRTSSDVDPASYVLFDKQAGKLTRVGDPYPAIDRTQLQAARPISYPARDGTSIPGYLTVPKDGAKGLPLIVLPHGGPISRDTLGYDFLRQFLVSRGYAVLQMNFRGSGSLGTAWFDAADQDWGGLTYDDVVDGARWAIKEGIADPGRVAIVGWSFGGYLALLGAQRNADLFKCAVSIAGISDLAALIAERYVALTRDIVKRQIGTDPAKLERDSPRAHAPEFTVPVLLVHGDHDQIAPFDQSRAMSKVLSKAGKSSRFVPIKDARHGLERGSDRETLLRELEAFLVKNVPVSAPH